jgi:hypothetical protein
MVIAMRKSKQDHLKKRVNELLAEGVTLRDACARVAQEEEIDDLPRLSGAAYVERQWASDDEPPAPSQVRAGRRGRQFI